MKISKVGKESPGIEKSLVSLCILAELLSLMKIGFKFSSWKIVQINQHHKIIKKKILGSKWGDPPKIGKSKSFLQMI